MTGEVNEVALMTEAIGCRIILGEAVQIETEEWCTCMFMIAVDWV
jgi:hypothetical protein